MTKTARGRDAARIVASLLALHGLAACAPAPITADQPRKVAAMPLPPFEIHEECVHLAPGDRLDYDFAASEPVAFEIQYREGGAVLAPIVRSASVGDSGVFLARLEHNYCLAWEAGAAGALVDFQLKLRPAAR
jgi:hypothetical protein